MCRESDKNFYLRRYRLYPPTLLKGGSMSPPINPPLGGQGGKTKVLNKNKIVENIYLI